MKTIYKLVIALITIIASVGGIAIIGQKNGGGLFGKRYETMKCRSLEQPN